MKIYRIIFSIIFIVFISFPVSAQNKAEEIINKLFAAMGGRENRVEIYPVKGSGGERMMVVYFTEYKVL